MEMNISKNEEVQLQSFINKLRRNRPASNLFLEVKDWPSEKKGEHHLVLQVMDPDFQFDLHANGNDLKDVLVKLEESFDNEVSRRKAMYLMLQEGIDQNSPFYSRYLN